MRLAVGFRPNPARNSQCSPDPLTGFRRWASEPKRGRGKEGKQGEERRVSRERKENGHPIFPKRS